MAKAPKPKKVVVKEGKWKAIQQSVLDLKNAYVKVGYFPEAPRADRKVTVAEIAYWNEFGTGRIPARSFMRRWFDTSKPALLSFMRKVYQNVLTGKTNSFKALGLVGEYGRAGVIQQITATLTPPNAPATIRKKKSTHPLIDTGTMRASTSYRTFTKTFGEELPKK